MPSGVARAFCDLTCICSSVWNIHAVRTLGLALEPSVGGLDHRIRLFMGRGRERPCGRPPRTEPCERSYRTRLLPRVFGVETRVRERVHDLGSGDPAIYVRQ
jgi:hypothetical protein